MKSRFISNDEGCDQAAADIEYTALREALAEQAEQEPFAYEVWDKNDQVLILIYASYLEEFHWIEKDDIARKLYAAPVATKDLTDEEIDALVDSACDSQMSMDMFARTVIAAFKEKNWIK